MPAVMVQNFVTAVTARDTQRLALARTIGEPAMFPAPASAVKIVRHTVIESQRSDGTRMPGTSLTPADELLAEVPLAEVPALIAALSRALIDSLATDI